MCRILLCLVISLYASSIVSGQSQSKKYSAPPLSSEANIGFDACPDTVFKFLFLQKVLDISILLPTWYPVISYEDITQLEGTVIPKPNSKHIDTHVSPSDFPFHHYTHDFTFNVAPDKTVDNRYTNLLANRIITVGKKGKETTDTILMDYIHVEWESGLGASNDGNPCSEQNKLGNSCGFFTAGHKRRDVIWNWPTLGDWVHVEGLWLWDRGHPPARTEIHPARLVAIRRKLPANLIDKLDGKSDVFATRIDVFASGDGGALNNNWKEKAGYVRAVKMSDKDYSFRVKHLLKQPSPNAIMRFKVEKHKGDTYLGKPAIRLFPKGDKENPDAFVEVNIPWKNLSDTLVFARTIYLYWDENNGIPSDFNIHKYKVTLNTLKFKKRKECYKKSNFRVFLGVEGEYLFYNEFIDVEQVLADGIGSTRKRVWEIDKEFFVHVPEKESFRVYIGGWEVDGIDLIMGSLMDPYSPCNSDIKEWVNDKMSIASPLKFQGCLDDHIGELHAIHKSSDLKKINHFEGWSDGREERDFCLCNTGKQNKIFKLDYTIERLE
ncbi:MAG TPA: hypothetical protein EYN89_06730 [Flavobacteriales bacterium]|nr:hypothetical protein [Flavobacteriales bacterium]